MKKVLFVINPVAGNGRGEKAASEIKELIDSKNLPAEIYLSNKPKDITEFVSQLDNDNFRKVVAVGGDGTVNEAVNGVLKNGAGLEFGVLGVGSGNDFARVTHSESDITTSVQHFIEKTEYKICDAAKVKYITSDNTENEHFFINSLGVGFDAQIAFIKSQSGSIPGLKGYVLALIKALKTYAPVDCKIKIDSTEPFELKTLLVTAGNGITSGGGFYLNPDAKIDDGILDFTTIDFVKRLKILYKLPLALVNKLHKVPEARFYNFENIEISLREPYYIHVDGEVLSDKVIKINIEILKSALKLG